ncbi:creatininase family protein, partial [Candidatus Altiarchaeota archaeon]
GHGGNSKTLRQLQIENVVLLDIIQTLTPYDHAGEIETSLILHLCPEKVRRKEIKKHKFSYPKKEGWKTKDHSESGVLGDPTGATAENGERYLGEIVSNLLEQLKE